MLGLKLIHVSKRGQWFLSIHLSRYITSTTPNRYCQVNLVGNLFVHLGRPLRYWIVLLSQCTMVPISIMRLKCEHGALSNPFLVLLLWYDTWCPIPTGSVFSKWPPGDAAPVTRYFAFDIGAFECAKTFLLQTYLQWITRPNWKLWWCLSYQWSVESRLKGARNWHRVTLLGTAYQSSD